MSSKAEPHAADDLPAGEQSRPAATAVEDEYEDAEKNYQPKSLKFWTIMIGLYLSVFIVALDRTIIATAIPRITDEFDSIQDIGWYGSAYMLTAACFFPVCGRMYQLYSTKWVFLASIVIFEVGSALCGAAPNSVSFIIGRAIAGSGSAGIFSGSIMVLLPLVPLRKRPVFTSMFGMAFGISSVLGPLVGGTFTDHVTWRWCFYVNLPIGAFTIIAILLFLNVASPQREKLTALGVVKRFDPLGILLLTPSMVSLILALQWGGSTYSWSAPTIIGLLVTFAVLFITFLVFEALTPKTAMVPTRVISNRSIAGSMLFFFLLSGSMMSVIYFLAIWFQAAKGDSPMHAGVSTIPLVLSLVVTSILGGVFTGKIGYYNPVMFLSPVLLSIGAGLLSTLSPSSGHSAWIGFQIIYGLGNGLGIQAPILAAQNVLPRADVPLGSALMFFIQQLGGAAFLAVSQNVFSSRLVGRLSGIAGLDPEAIVNTGATTLRTVVPPEQLDTVVEAYSYALTQVFVLAAILSACMVLGSVVVEWKKIRGKGEAIRSNSPEAETQNVTSDNKAHQ